MESDKLDTIVAAARQAPSGGNNQTNHFLVIRNKEVIQTLIELTQTAFSEMEAAIQWVFCIGKPAKARKAALLLSSGSPGVYDGAIAQFKAYTGYTGIEAVGVITANGAENKSEAKMNEIRAFAKGL